MKKEFQGNGYRLLYEEGANEEFTTVYLSTKWYIVYKKDVYDLLSASEDVTQLIYACQEINKTTNPLEGSTWRVDDII